MTLLNARDLSETVVDDRSPTLWNSYVGNWTKSFDGNYTKYYQGTYTATSSPGDSFSFTFSGIQAFLGGGLFNANVSQDGHFISYPTADYLVDGNPVGPQVPFFNAGEALIYFQTDLLQDGPHTVNLTVTAANQTNLFIVDYYASYFIAGTHSSSSSTSTGPPSRPSDHVGAIAGSVVGGLTAIAILITGLLYFLKRRSRGDQDDYFEAPNPVYVVSDSYPIEPFYPAGDITQHTNPDNSNLPLNLSFRPSGVDSLPSQNPQPGGMTQTSTRKAALIAQPSGEVQRPIQHEDSGIRFNPYEEQEPARSQSPPEVPPKYTQS